MTKIPHLFAIAAVATLGFTACEDKKASTPETKKEESAKEEPKPAALQPSAPKPTQPAPTTDEVINAPPDAAPAPPPPKPAPAPEPANPPN